MSTAGRRTINGDSANAPITEEQLRHHSQELGWFGKVFGSKQQAAVIFAGVIGTISCIGLILVGVLAPSGEEKGTLLAHLGTVVIAAFTFLGGIFGAGSSK